MSQSQPMTILTSKASVEWYTPPAMAEKIRFFLGEIDLDPASSEEANRTIQAKVFFSEQEDGLARPWSTPEGEPATVFLNPPFNGYSARWLKKFKEEYRAGRVKQGVALINSAPGYNWFEDLWREFPMILLRERLEFQPAGGGPSPGQAKKGQALVYYGLNWINFVASFSDLGRVSLPSSGMVLGGGGSPQEAGPSSISAAEVGLIREYQTFLGELYLRHDRIASMPARLLLGGSVLTPGATRLINELDVITDEMEGFFRLLLGRREYARLSGIEEDPPERFVPPPTRSAPPLESSSAALKAWSQRSYPELKGLLAERLSREMAREE